MSALLTVYYDGACPPCRREIDFYRHRRGAERVAWVNVSAAAEDRLAPGLCRADALARFHVRTADGHLVSGARAFAALWAGLPQFRWLGRIAGTRLALPVLEVAYRRFLRWHPAMQRLAAQGDAPAASGYPRWLERELRSDHAGEARWDALRASLETCRDDELEHRDEARANVAGALPLALRLWTACVDVGSRAGVAIARRL